MLLLDLDRFKVINDSLGHHAGDEVLVAVAKRLLTSCRTSDTVARLGGDEFAIVLVEPAEAAGSAAQRILAALSPPFSVVGHTIPLGASVGVVEPWPEETGVTPDVLVHRADRAMYAGKRGGKGIAVHYRPELARTLEPAESTLEPAESR
jgi:diguanylate cyclase (GGDEF)-like protein